MTSFEYKVVPAPTRGLKAKGVKGTPARFANALQSVMNELGAEGWEYQRTDTLPVEERQGLTGKTTSFQNLLVFRRALSAPEADVAVAALIEDQTYVLEQSDAATQDAPVDDIPTPEKPVAVEPAETPQKAVDAPKEAPSPSERVTETLTAPVVLPWNKRRAQADPAQSGTGPDRTDDNIPAE